MAKFVWQPAGQEPMAFAIRQERVAVGRDAGNDIRLPEPAVSSRHAVVITRMGQTTVHDLNSSNGTWVNGRKVESQRLQHGDVVQFGRLAMTYVDESTVTSGTQPRTERDATQRDVPRPAAPAVPAGHLATGAFAAERPRPEGPDISELDRLMGAIREYRSGESQQSAAKREAMLLEWQQVMQYCTALKTRLGSETRVRFFEISERRNEVVLRVERAAGQPTALVMLTWGPLDHRERVPDGIWMRQPGYPDKRYEKASDVTRDLVAAVAHMLA